MKYKYQIVESIPNGFIDVSAIFRSLPYSRRSKNFNNFSKTNKFKQFFLDTNHKIGIDSIVLCKKNNKGLFHTFAHKDIIQGYVNWIDGLIRLKAANFSKENDFVLFIIESFTGILQFERQFNCLDYRIDLYCRSLNLCIEFDENYHKYQIQYEKKQNDIINYLGCQFIRHSEKDFVSITINKIIKIWQESRKKNNLKLFPEVYKQIQLT